jgi:gas vesicle protein
MLVAGLAAGLGAGLLMRSKKGQKLTEGVKRAAQETQDELAKKLKQTKHFSQTEYDTMVKEVVGHYQRAKRLSAAETADMQEFLLGQWQEIESKLLK